jgi:glucose-1-phosphate thymidylyltransferase
MKGIILAGGRGTRLRPITSVVNKHILPVYDKPMIFYPLSILMLAGIRDILIICNPHDIQLFRNLFGDGGHLGLKITYDRQEEPNGVAEALIIGESFIDNDKVCLILADNLFVGEGFSNALRKSFQLDSGAIVYGYKVNDPQRFGVVEFDENGTAKSIIEKPTKPKSNFAVTGLYFYDENASIYAKTLKKSSRGELEITELNKIYLDQRKLKVEILGRGFIWMDMGTIDALNDAGILIKGMQHSQGFMVGCLEEIALTQGWTTEAELELQVRKHTNTKYGSYLKGLTTQKSLLRRD